MSRKVQNWVTGGLLLVGLLLLAFGSTRGEPLRVMEKAVRVCLECIGVG